MSIDIEICAAALVRVGAEPISTLEGAGGTNTACRNLYPSIRRDALSGYRWRFSTKFVTLERLSALPRTEQYDSSYQLPANTETLWNVAINGFLVDFDRSESLVFLDAESDAEVIGEVGFMPDEYYWPGYFRTLIELQLASALAIPIAEDATKATYYENKALRQYALAKTLDSQTRTARKIDLGGLRRYHRGSA